MCHLEKTPGVARRRLNVDSYGDVAPKAAKLLEEGYVSFYLCRLLVHYRVQTRVGLAEILVRVQTNL